MNALLKILSLQLLIASVALSQHDDVNDYFYSLYFGYNQSVLDEKYSDSATYFSFHAYPRSYKNGMGIHLGYVGIPDENEFWDDERFKNYFYYIQPRLYYQGRFLGLVPGFIIFTFIGSKDVVINGIILPSLSIKFGNLRKWYFSLNGLHDLYFGFFSIKVNYIIADDFSNISFGFTRGIEDNTMAFAYQIQLYMYKNMYLGIRGQKMFENSGLGIQGNIGMVL